MARPRLPTALHEMKGTYKVNPERRPKAEPKPSGPLGAPPKRLDKVQREAWDEIVSEAPANVLTRADRKVVEIAARLMADVWQAPELKPALVARLQVCLGSLGMTPADRSKVAALPEEKQASPWDDLGPVQ